jgi:hypothetical protein
MYPRELCSVCSEDVQNRTSPVPWLLDAQFDMEREEHMPFAFGMPRKKKHSSSGDVPVEWVQTCFTCQ